MFRRDLDLAKVSTGLNGCFAEDDNGDVCTFHRSIATELIQRGVIFERDGKWRIKTEDANIVEEKYPFLGVCDFCSSRPIAFDVDARTYEDETGHVSMGGWAACEECGKLIIARDRNALFDRAVKAGRLSGHDHVSREIRRTLAAFYEQFWRNFKSIKPFKPHPFGH